MGAPNPSRGAAEAEAAGVVTPSPALADWQRLHFPTEDEWIRISEAYPETFGVDFYSVPPWIRLGWPSEELHANVAASKAKIGSRPVAAMRWAELQELYPDRPNVDARDQDLARLARCWPDCFGQPIVEIDLQLTEGITINQLTYGPGHHRVPKAVATDLRFIDSTARQHFLDQFIPKKHQDRVIATLSMKGSAASGDIAE